MTVNKDLAFPGGFFQHADFFLIRSDRESIVSRNPLRRNTGCQGNHVSGKDESLSAGLNIRYDLPRRMSVEEAQVDVRTKLRVGIDEAQLPVVGYRLHVFYEVRILFQCVRMQEIFPLPAADPVCCVGKSRIDFSRLFIF